MLTKRTLLRSSAAAAALMPGAVAAQTNPTRPGFFKARDIAEEGFIFGLPLVIKAVQRYGMTSSDSASKPLRAAR
jgi:hypothetical protein